MTKQFTAIVAVALSVLSVSAGLAQTAHKPLKHTTAKPRMVSKPVYVCKDCMEYFSMADAKKMGYKDSMGHTLTRAAKVPAGYLDGTKSGM